MNEAACKKRFYHLVHPTLPNEWEIDDLLCRFAQLAPERQEDLFRQVPAIWPVSQSLCLAFLEQGVRRVAVPDHLMADWVRTLLHAYECDGLSGARKILADGGALFLASREASSTVPLQRISRWLGPFVSGLAGVPMELAPGRVAATDTVTLVLPDQIDLCGDDAANTALYKIVAALHVGFIRLGTFRLVPDDVELTEVRDRFGKSPAMDQPPLAPDYFELFPEPQLAADLFFIGECERVMQEVGIHLPGLARQWCIVSAELAERLPAESTGIGETLSRLTLAVLDNVAAGPSGRAAPVGLETVTASPFAVLVQRYLQVAGRGEAYCRPRILDVLGHLDFPGVAGQLEARRAVVREAFVLQIARLLAGHRDRAGEQGQSEGERADNAQIMLVEAGEHGEQRLVLTIDNHRCELPEEAQALAAEILNDQGLIPSTYIAAAVGVAGGGRSDASQDCDAEADPMDGRATGARLVDEWDFRRQGYRKNWCAVYEKELPLVQSSFVAATLQTYRGTLVRLRRQFEMMRVNECFVGRQREGDELDLDAVVEARADRRASTAASERLFVRLQRNERDLATLFLVDLSNSTQGWVGTVIKEALVLLCEAMQVAGDRYGIYGFSGMRRSRCELFPLKRLDEPYGEPVARRIGSMAPREYTRLGPAIRSAAELLRSCDARTRLLMTLTDGKPEDYDDYKGDYAIEDTRKALLEARGAGLHAFGVTVDRQGRDYLPRIFGRDHYVLIDNVHHLPQRMLDIYRQLTV